MEYEVTVDFGDNAVQAPHICRSQTDLGLYLERVPSMLGFEANGVANVKIVARTIQRKTHIKETRTT